MNKTIVFVFIFYIINISCMKALNIDMVSSPKLLSVAEITLLAPTPASAFYQPALYNTGIAFNHSNPFGFTELNVLHMATQFKIKNEMFSLGSVTLNNEIIDDKVVYIGYSKNLNNISLGISARYYHFGIKGYDSIDTFTTGIGAVWGYDIFTHGLSYSNITNTNTKGIDLPSVFKYECLISTFDNTRFGIALEKEKSFEMRYAFAANQEINKYLYIMSGFITNPNQFSAGFTCVIGQVEISYGFRTHAQLSYTQAVGVGWRFK